MSTVIDYMYLKPLPIPPDYFWRDFIRITSAIVGTLVFSAASYKFGKWFKKFYDDWAFTNELN